MRFEELEAKLRAKLKVKQEAAKILDDTDKAEQTVPKDDDDFFDLAGDDPKSTKHSPKKQKLKERFVPSIGIITYILDPINYNIAPIKREFSDLLSKPETVADCQYKLLHTFKYANEIFTEIGKKANPEEPFQTFVEIA